MAQETKLEIRREKGKARILRVRVDSGSVAEVLYELKQSDFTGTMAGERFEAQLQGAWLACKEQFAGKVANA